MKRITSLLFLSLLLSISFRIWPRDWYVDNAADQGNTGLTWETAWRSFNDIQWGEGGAGPGDTIYISGGITSKLYQETLNIPGSGEPGNPITIRVGQEDGHNGKVIITSNEAFGGIFIYPAQHIIVDGEYNNSHHIILRDCAQNGVYVYNSDNIVLRYLEVDHNGYGGNDGNGIRIYFEEFIMFICEVSHCIIHDNYQDQILSSNGNIDVYDFGYIKVHHCEIYNINDDGYEAGHGGIDYYNNIMHGRINEGGVGHPDGVYFANGYCRIYNNIFYNFSNGALISNSFIGMALRTPLIDDVWTQREASHIYIHNNLIYENVDTIPTNYLRGIAIGGAPNNVGITGLTNVVVSNNTIVGIPYWALALGLSELSASSTENDIMYLNNVYYNCHTQVNGPIYILIEPRPVINCTAGSFGDNADITIDYNCIHEGPDGTQGVAFKGVRYESLSDFNEAIGCEDHSIHANPLLSNVTFMPTSEDSPIIGSGLDLSFIINGNPEALDFMRYDMNGTLRPTGAWDMGAFQNTEGYELHKNLMPRNIRVK